MGACASSPDGVESGRVGNVKSRQSTSSRTVNVRVRGKRIRTRSPSMLAEEGVAVVRKDPEVMQLILDALSENSFFNARTPDQLSVIAGVMELQDVPQNAEVYTKDELGDVFYVVIKGNFEKRRDDDTDPVMMSSKAGFGEVALRYQTKRSESVVCVGAGGGTLAKVGRVAYQQVIVSQLRKEKSKHTGFLKKVKILSGLEESQLSALGNCLKRKKYKKGHKIIVQGDKGDAFFFIESGEVKCIQYTRKGSISTENEVGKYKKGDYFGEGALIKDVPRNADVVAIGSVTCLVLTKKDFDEQLGDLQNLIDDNFNARVLRGVELLSKLTDAERLEIARELVTETFEKDDVIIKQGDAGDKFYIIKEGQVEFLRQNEAGAKAESIGELFQGSVFGEGALLTNEARRASGYARGGTVTLLSFSRNIFSRVFDQSLQDMMNRDFDKRRNLDGGDGKKAIEFSDLEQIRILGAGTYGQVLLVGHKVTGKTYALKTMQLKKIRQMDQIEHVKNENKVLDMIRHPFLVNMVQSYMGKTYVYALIEAVMGGELFTHLRSVGRLKVPAAKFYLAQVTCVFEYLHSLDVVYRDLKPENMLIGADGYLKVTDFGLSKILDHEQMTYTLCGTPAYAAPEVYELSGHGKGVDWWGLGVLTHELISGATPFDGDAEEIFASIGQFSKCYPNIRLPKRITGAANDFTLKLLHPNQNRRLGCSHRGAYDVKHHSFFENYNWRMLLAKKIEVPFLPKITSMYDTKNFYDPNVSKRDAVHLDEVELNAIKPDSDWNVLS